MTTPAMGLDREGISRLTPREKRYYLLALITVATSDDEIAEEELSLIKSRAKALNCQLKRSDLKTYDIARIADEIRKPSLRTALFQDMIAMARADRHWHPEELKILRFFSEEWALSLPQQPFMGVQWADILVPTPEELEQTSFRRREVLGSASNRKIIGSADPGIRWGWVAVGTGIYLGISIVFGILIAVFRGDEAPGFGESDLLNTILGLFACFLTGLIVGSISSVRTLREPAIGVILPLVAIGGVMILAAMASGSGGVLVVTVLGIGLAATVQFGCALLGAWIAEKFTDN